MIPLTQLILIMICSINPYNIVPPSVLLHSQIFIHVMLTFQILHLSLRPHDNQTQPSHITAIRSPYNLRHFHPERMMILNLELISLLISKFVL